MVWGRFGKTGIFLPFVVGFKRTMYQMKGYFPSTMQCRHGDNQMYLQENINQNPIFSLFIF